jgi:hypothetical protein
VEVIRAQREQAAAGPALASREIVFGPMYAERMAGIARNLEEGRIITTMAVFEKP